MNALGELILKIGVVAFNRSYETICNQRRDLQALPKADFARRNGMEDVYYRNRKSAIGTKGTVRGNHFRFAKKIQ